MIDVKHYVQYNFFFNKNVKLKTEIYIYTCMCIIFMFTIAGKTADSKVSDIFE